MKGGGSRPEVTPRFNNEKNDLGRFLLFPVLRIGVRGTRPVPDRQSKKQIPLNPPFFKGGKRGSEKVGRPQVDPPYAWLLA
jgi:hypothetical protein